MSYQTTYDYSLAKPEEFWAEAAEGIHWFKKWDQVLDATKRPIYRWFKGGKVNSCYNALDYHVENGRGEQAALIYDSPVTNTVKTFTYRELLEQTALFAGVLTELGIKKGDRVIIYMPMVPETVIAMLGCARIGAIHSVVFGGFAANELSTRIDDAEAKVIVSASCGIEVNRTVEYKPLLDQAINLAQKKPQKTIILQRPEHAADLIPDRDLDWHQQMDKAAPVSWVELDATDPLYILYTSGTTGVPKGVVRDNGGHLVALKWSMKNIYGVEPGEVYWAASDLGWTVGHSYIVYAPLFNGNTTVLYEGKPVGTPDPGAFWRVVSQHNVSVLFTAPTVFRAIKREDPDGDFIRKYDLKNFRTLFLAGERCDPDTLKWAETQLNVPVIDHWWQTETGWPVGCNCIGLEMFPVKPGSCAKPVPGYDVQILDEETGKEVDRDKIGTIAIKLPLPPGCFPTLWKNDRGFIKTYLSTFDGYYYTADAGYKDKDGYLWVMSRTDDIINVAGHRLSTGGMEEVLAAHPDVAECAVVGMADSIKGEVPLGLIVLKSGVDRSTDLIVEEVKALVRENIGPVASFKLATVVKRLPKTRSGKILRGTMKKIADSQTYRMPATIDDPAVLAEIQESFQKMGILD